MTKNYIKSLMIFSCILTEYAAVHAQGIEWVKGIGGKTIDECRSVATDAQHNVYFAGGFRDSVSFDPEGGKATYKATGPNSDIFVCKIKSDGSFVWANSIGGTGYDAAKAITTDKEGNIYITGQYSDSVNFEPGTNNYILKSTGKEDIFVCKLNKDGKLLWAKGLGGQLTDVGLGIAAGKEGIYITGYYAGDMDANPGTGVAMLNSVSASHDIFILKLSNDGDYIWAKSIGGAWIDQGSDIVLDPSDNIYITGYYSSDASGVDFDPAKTNKKLVSKGAPDIFALKLDKDGKYVWAKSMGGGFQDMGNSIALDAGGNVYLTGYFTGFGADFDPSPGSTAPLNASSVVDVNIFACKLNKDGDYVWAKSMGGSSFGGIEQGNAIVVDASGNVLLTGTFKDLADFDPGPQAANLLSGGNEDAFVCKLDNDGAYLWAINVGGPQTDRGSSIALGEGNIFVQGTFQATASFGSGSNPFSLVNKGTNSDDIFILKLLCNDTSSSVVNETGCGSYMLNGETYTSSGKFTQILPNAAGCDSTITLNLTIIRPDTSVTVTGGTFSADNLSASAYQWVDCNNNYAAIEGAVGQTFTPQKEGNYAVIITENGCTDTSSCYTYEKESGIQQIDLASIFIYPNPAINNLYIESSIPFRNAVFKLYNITGKILSEQHISGYRHFVNVKDYVPGIYFIEISEYDRTIRRKLAITE